VGIYFSKTKLWRVETGYMFQSFWKSAEDLNERQRINHTFRLTLVSEAPFSQKNEKMTKNNFK